MTVNGAERGDDRAGEAIRSRRHESNTGKRRAAGGRAARAAHAGTDPPGWRGLRPRGYWPDHHAAGQLRSIDVERIFAADRTNFSGMAKTEAQVFHRQRYREATQAVGKIGSHVLDWVVCRETPLDQVGYTLGWGSRPQAYAAAVERMKTALDELSKLWGLVR
jgi:hypothetical protein